MTRLASDRFWLVGSYQLQQWHWRWFEQHLPATGVTLENLSESWLGFSLSGPRAREVLARLTSADVSNAALPLFACRQMDVGPTQSVVARLSLTGEMGYEINVPASQQRALWQSLHEAGRDYGLRDIGMRAQDSLRLEKGYGIWSLEYSAACTPAMAGLERFIAFDKGEFIGREAALRERSLGAAQRLVLLAVETANADASGYEPVWHGDRKVGYVTSGGYGYHLNQSLALAYVDSQLLQAATLGLRVDIIGKPCPARWLPEAPYDPAGLRLRG